MWNIQIQCHPTLSKLEKLRCGNTEVKESLYNENCEIIQMFWPKNGKHRDLEHGFSCIIYRKEKYLN